MDWDCWNAHASDVLEVQEEDGMVIIEEREGFRRLTDGEWFYPQYLQDGEWKFYDDGAGGIVKWYEEED